MRTSSYLITLGGLLSVAAVIGLIVQFVWVGIIAAVLGAAALVVYIFLLVVFMVDTTRHP